MFKADGRDAIQCFNDIAKWPWNRVCEARDVAVPAAVCRRQPRPQSGQTPSGEAGARSRFALMIWPRKTTQAALIKGHFMPIANIRGVDIHHEVIGSTGPWLALITGGRRSYAEFVPLASRIAERGFRVLLHDRRNTGASQILIEGDEQGEEEIWTDDIAALLDHLGATPAFVGGASSGARTSMLTALRHPRVVRALMLMRVTGGPVAAARLPDMYYGQFIRAAREGGMAAVCATEQYRERIAARPANEAYLREIDPTHYIRVMSHWLAVFERGPRAPVLGLTGAQMAAIRVPTIVVPGNDNTHASGNGIACAAAIPGSELHRLPIEDLDVPLLSFTEWAPHETELARVFADFMRRVGAR